jgi:hypothetical protein
VSDDDDRDPEFGPCDNFFPVEIHCLIATILPDFP